jgi:hypothetical protein
MIGKFIGICKKSPESGRNFLYKKFSISTIFRKYIFEMYLFSRLYFRNVLFFENIHFRNFFYIFEIMLSKTHILENFWIFSISWKIERDEVEDTVFSIKDLSKFLILKIYKVSKFFWKKKFRKHKSVNYRNLFFLNENLWNISRICRWRPMTT